MSLVEKRIAKTKIKRLQLDLFGFCNAKCWYCPVRYVPQPEEGKVQMPIEMVERIFQQFTEERDREDGIVVDDFNLFMTTHYSEILLYQNFEELLKLARKYGLYTMILSNGVNLTKEKVDIIREYSDVVLQVGLNIPAFEEKLWADRTGFLPKQFYKLMDNLKYAGDQLDFLGENLCIHVNGINKDEFNSNFVSRGPKFGELNMNLDPKTGEHEKQYKLAKKMFPAFNVGKATLMDRGGMITDYIDNQKYMTEQLKEKVVVGCNNWGDRTTEWVHINSRGDLILCCNDYHFDYIFGNIGETDLRDIWGSPKHVETVERAYENICTKCVSAITV